MRILSNLKSKKLFVALFLLAAYPAFVLIYVWVHCYESGLEGGKAGQLDAYRHTLASAVVAQTLSPEIVTLVTIVMERKARPTDLMDRHNNAIGAGIGQKSDSFSNLDELVLQHVKSGAENTVNKSQITWLPKQFWKKSLFW